MPAVGKSAEPVLAALAGDPAGECGVGVGRGPVTTLVVVGAGALPDFLPAPVSGGLLREGRVWGGCAASGGGAVAAAGSLVGHTDSGGDFRPGVAGVAELDDVVTAGGVLGWLTGTEGDAVLVEAAVDGAGGAAELLGDLAEAETLPVQGGGPVGGAAAFSGGGWVGHG